MARERGHAGPGVAPQKRVFIWRKAIRDSDLSSNAKLVAFTLSTYMNTAGEAWPSLNTLVKGASIAKSTVTKALKELEAKGWIRRFRKKKPGTKWNDVTRYLLVMSSDARTTFTTEETRGSASNEQRLSVSDPRGSSAHGQEVSIEGGLKCAACGQKASPLIDAGFTDGPVCMSCASSDDTWQADSALREAGSSSHDLSSSSHEPPTTKTAVEAHAS